MLGARDAPSFPSCMERPQSGIRVVGIDDAVCRRVHAKIPTKPERHRLTGNVGDIGTRDVPRLEEARTVWSGLQAFPDLALNRS